jgi:membrane protease YdiL (CAAX protease family)
MVLCIPTGFGAYLILEGVCRVFGLDYVDRVMAERIETAKMISRTPFGWMPLIALYVGVYEEIVFRGFLLSRLKVLLRGTTAAVIASAAIFAILHLPQGVLAVGQIFGLGLLFGAIAAWRRDLWPCIIAHALWDMMAFALMFMLTFFMKEFDSDLFPMVLGI